MKRNHLEDFFNEVRRHAQGSDRIQGTTTRLIDKYVQQLFKGESVILKDHHPSRTADDHLINKLLERLYREHGIETTTDFNKLISFNQNKHRIIAYMTPERDGYRQIKLHVHSSIQELIDRKLKRTTRIIKPSEEELFELEQQLDIPHKDRFYKTKQKDNE